MQIFKFGGASVENPDGVRRIFHIISQSISEKLLVVISAMGKTTNALERLAKFAFDWVDYSREFHDVKSFHEQICLALFGEVPSPITNWLLSLEQALGKPSKNWLQFYDQIVSFGELISTSIVYEYMKVHSPCTWVDARNYVKTNGDYTEAAVDWQLTEQFIARDIPGLLTRGVVITQGFIGADQTGNTTTLGREGSDFTGAIFANCLNAKSLTVWKDVPGLLNADPKKFEAAQLFSELSFQEVTELTFYGAKVIHPKTIRPLAQKGIPLYVKSFLNPKEPGTLIAENEKLATIPCFVFMENQLLVTLRVRDNSFMDEKKLVKIFQALDHTNVKINLMHNSALTFTFCMDFQTIKLERVREYLDKEFLLLYNEGLSLATIKNYQADSFGYLPADMELILEQKTRNNYQVVYRARS